MVFFGPLRVRHWSWFSDRGRAGLFCGAGHGSSNLGEALDVQRHLTAQVAFDGVVMVDHFTQGSFLIVGEILHTGVGVDVRLGQNVLALLRPMPKI